jgi:hypothetical protein
MRICPRVEALTAKSGFVRPDISGCHRNPAREKEIGARDAFIKMSAMTLRGQPGLSGSISDPSLFALCLRSMNFVNRENIVVLMTAMRKIVEESMPKF